MDFTGLEDAAKAAQAAAKDDRGFTYFSRDGKYVFEVDKVLQGQHAKTKASQFIVTGRVVEVLREETNRLLEREDGQTFEVRASHPVSDQELSIYFSEGKWPTKNSAQLKEQAAAILSAMHQGTSGSENVSLSDYARLAVGEKLNDPKVTPDDAGIWAAGTRIIIDQGIKEGRWMSSTWKNDKGKSWPMSWRVFSPCEDQPTLDELAEEQLGAAYDLSQLG